jgi:hypothetical protein
MAKFEMDPEFVRKLAQILHETNLGKSSWPRATSASAWRGRR